MHYYLYQITNKVNGKVYVGVHKTNRLDDGYMGSGKVLRRAFTKHGAENFEKVILETFDSAAAMYAREKEVVDDEFLKREDTYNLRRGGTGGFDYINSNGLAVPNITTENSRECSQRGLAALRSKPEVRRRISRAGGLATSGFKGKRHSEATKAKMRAVDRSGAKNSQFGSIWITDGEQNKKTVGAIPDGWRRGRSKVSSECKSAW